MPSANTLRLTAVAFVLSFLNFSKPALGATTFSALTGQGSAFFAGLRSQKDVTSEVVASVVEIDYREIDYRQIDYRRIEPEKLSWRRITLPKEARNREVIALLATGKKLLVVTQWTIEQGDDPLVHGYDLSTRKWTRMGRVACPGVRKIRASVAKLVFDCEETDPAGPPRQVEKTLVLKKGFGAFNASNELPPVELPMTRARAGEAVAELQGDRFRWDQLKVTSKSGERILKASKLGR